MTARLKTMTILADAVIAYVTVSVPAMLLLSDTVLISLIGAVGSLMAAILTLFNTMLVRRAEQHILANTAITRETKDTVAVLERNTNSMKDALVAVTGSEQRAIGVQEGIAASTAVANAKTLRTLAEKAAGDPNR
jgi:hypothetical protein